MAVIYKSLDNGLTWQPMKNYTNSYMRGAAAIPNSETIFVYGNCIIDHQPVLFTDISFNKGSDWNYSLLPEYSGYVPVNSKITAASSAYIVGYTKKDKGFLIANENLRISTDVKPNYNKPDNFLLEQNYPNPFNPSTTISFSVPSGEFVTLKVYDVLGNEIATLVNEVKPAGKYEIEFNGSDLSSGIYLFRIASGEFMKTIKTSLMK